MISGSSCILWVDLALYAVRWFVGLGCTPQLDFEWHAVRRFGGLGCIPTLCEWAQLGSSHSEVVWRIGLPFALGPVDSVWFSWTRQLLWYRVSSENPWLSLVRLCVQRAVAELDSNEICFLCSPWASAAAVSTCGSIYRCWSCSPDSLSKGASWVEKAKGMTACLVVAAGWSASQGDVGWARHLPEGWPDGGPWSTDGKWMQRRAAPAHAPIPKLPHLQINDPHSLVSLNYYTTAVIGFFYPLEVVMLLMFIVIFSQSLYLKYNVFLHRTYFDSMMMLHKLCEKVAK